MTAVPDRQVLLTDGELQLHGAIGSHHKTGPVEHQLVVAPHLIEVDQWAIEALRRRRRQLLAQGWLGGIEGGSRQIDHQIRLFGDQLIDGIRSVQALALQAVIHPEVFADGEAQSLPVGQAEQAGSITGAEVAPLIKDVVTGQQLFLGNRPPAQAIHQHHTVVQPWTAGIGCGQRSSHQQGDAAVQLVHQPLQHRVLLLDAAGLEQLVPGGIPPEGEFRGEHQLNSLLFCPAHGLQNPLRVALEVADHGVELRQGDAHQQRLPERP